jgi:hypothetical protein
MKLRVVLALSVSILVACATARMALPADVALASEELPITDRSGWSGALADETFGLGPYKVEEVDRKWDSKSTTSFGSMDSSKTSGGYSFKLTGAGAQLSGQCATESRQKSGDIGGGWSFGSNVAKLGCSCHDGAANAELWLEAATGSGYEGMFKSAEGEAHVLAIHEREGGSPSSEPTGYRIDGSETTLGAVDVMGKGRVWISKTLEGRARADVACLFAGLLLYLPPKDR